MDRAAYAWQLLLPRRHAARTCLGQASASPYPRRGRRGLATTRAAAQGTQGTQGNPEDKGTTSAAGLLLAHMSQTYGAAAVRRRSHVREEESVHARSTSFSHRLLTGYARYGLNAQIRGKKDPDLKIIPTNKDSNCPSRDRLETPTPRGRCCFGGRQSPTEKVRSEAVNEIVSRLAGCIALRSHWRWWRARRPLLSPYFARRVPLCKTNY